LTLKTFGRIAAVRVLLVPSLSLALFTSCKKEEIKIYRVPKEQAMAAPSTPASAANSATTPGEPSGRPQIGWKTPDGWEERPADRARVVSFIIKGEGKEGAEVAVMPFAGMAGNDLQFVNLWRDQLKLAPVQESELGQYTEAVTVGGVEAKLFDVYGKDSATSKERPTERIIVAMLRQDSVTWFFKLAGDGPVVVREKPKFIEFLKTIDFRGSAPSATTTAAAPSAPAPGGEGKPQWEVPSAWKEVVPGQMLLARFTLAETPKTEVTVSVFPGDVGGLLANVNRWRGQVKLPPIDQATLDKTVNSLDASGGKATLVDMTGGDSPKTRIIGAVVPRGGQTWFYKLMGDEQVAEREKTAFLKFVQTAKYSDAR
jgi:hypothetical protein